MPVPNKAMMDQARQGLELRKEYGRGGTAVGVARARDIANGADLSMATVGRMKSYFARHGANYSEHYGEKEADGGPNAFTIAWKLWGGTPGRAWANRVFENEDDRMLERAAPDGLAVGDYVTWDSSGGQAYGRVRRIQRDGTINVPDTDFSIEGTEDDPAALIMLYREVEDGWRPAGQLVGHKFSTLTKVQERAIQFETEDRHIQQITETEDQIIIVFGKSDEYVDESEDDDMDEAAYGKKKKKKKYQREARQVSNIEVRNLDDNTVTVEGYAAVFNQETTIGGQWREQIAPGAFSDALDRDDVVFLINHDGLPLARTRSGTLELSEDDHGLKMKASLDISDPDVRSIVPKMKRGDLDKMSFAFMPTRQAWQDGEEMPLRTIQEASLFDVSIVTTPAYGGTDIGLRSFQEYQEQRSRSHVARRLRMKSKLLK